MLSDTRPPPSANIVASPVDTGSTASHLLKRHSSTSAGSEYSGVSESGLAAASSSALPLLDHEDFDPERSFVHALPVKDAARLGDAAADSVRWWILALACMLMFGNYYAYDMPAALNKPMQQYLNEPDEAYQYQLNLLYSLYSLPNIVLPFLGGWLVDRFGTRQLMTALSCLVCLGQLLFTIGIIRHSYVLMHFGRVVFGLGGESLSVAQTRITTKWFKGKELAFALGVNLSVSRLGTVLTDFLSPYLALKVSFPSAIWVGLVTCLISLVCGVALNFVDEYGSNLKASNGGGGYELLEMRTKQHQKSRRGSIIAPLSPTIRPQRISPVKSARRSRSRGSGVSSSSGVEEGTGLAPFSFNDVFDFPLPFWQVVLVMCLMFATVIPFNAIHGALLELRWYHGNPQKAAQIMSIPDIISAFIVPFVGTFVDNFGWRSKVLFVCGASMAVVHLILGFMPTRILTSPIPVLIILGFSYALLLTFWPCIPLVVPERRVATAFGLATSAQNLALTVFPLIVASLVNWDGTYRLTEFFFASVSILGSLVCLWMHWYDVEHLNGVLDRPTVATAVGGSSRND
ncbi:major facilitator superfamily domain-containing protein [Chytriomyces sp. MP71]|nr:major facilitator superfamily domain-containing protein [Chytriomyces sp. MP71]